MTSQFGRMERAGAAWLSRFPGVKAHVKSLYARMAYALHRKGFRSQSIVPVESVGTDNSEESFFGYYDKSPVSESGCVLVHLSDQPTSRLPGTEPIRLAVLEHGAARLKLEVQAYNWQQGSRAHWVDPDRFLFNDFDVAAGRYISRMWSCSLGKEIARIPLAAQDSHGPDFVIGVDFRRLSVLEPDYGYRNLPGLSAAELDDSENDGVWAFRSGDSSPALLVSLREVLELDAQEMFLRAGHSLNHAMLSPSGERFVFIHRYFRAGRRHDRLVLWSGAGNGLRLLAKGGIVSHLCWVDDGTLLGFLTGPCGRTGYWILELDGERWHEIPGNPLERYGDGHPHACGDWFVTDTYPDRARMQHLMMCNWKTGELRHLGQFHHPFAYEGATRCDLHPRFGGEGTQVWFDSVFSGRRSLYRMDI